MTRLSLCIVTVAVVGPGCAEAWKSTPHDRMFQRTPPPPPHSAPSSRRPLKAWHRFVHSTSRPLGEALSPGTYVDLAAGGTPASDVNAFGQVVDSTWFTNRLARRDIPPGTVANGPNALEGPAPGPLTVVSGKLLGATPGLVVKDASDNVFIVKFDPPAFPELSSGAEVIATKVLWAAGYNVPENYVVVFTPDRLVLAPDATTGGKYGEIIPMTEQHLQELITHVNPFADGTVRALFSRILPGKLLGPFDYRGTEPEDPNDKIPHENRRSLRGLKSFAAWLNHTGIHAHNTMNVFVPRDGGPDGIVEHYLLDFNEALGAAGSAPKYIGRGYANRWDWADIGKTLFSAGLYYPYWLSVRRSPFRSVGTFESELFDPARWHPDFPNPAFDRATPEDEYWAAAIIARFRRDQLAAIIERARYSERGAADWVLRVLWERRTKILERAFDNFLALEDPYVRDGFFVGLVDLATQSGLQDGSRSWYRYRVYWNKTRRRDVQLLAGEAPSPQVDLQRVIRRAQSEFGSGLDNDPFVTVEWRRDGHDGIVRLHLRVLPDRLLPVALERE